MYGFFDTHHNYYQEMALATRHLARQTVFPSIRRKLVDIANQYDRMADYVSSIKTRNTADVP